MGVSLSSRLLTTPCVLVHMLFIPFPWVCVLIVAFHSRSDSTALLFLHLPMPRLLLVSPHLLIYTCRPEPGTCFPRDITTAPLYVASSSHIVHVMRRGQWRSCANFSIINFWALTGVITKPLPLYIVYIRVQYTLEHKYNMYLAFTAALSPLR
ncbi:hypothetical protein EDB83DRAFT_2463423 [Lactarius deliciosus]|nr:hypothetical protein EDB83DRAFT_2463423 [Lactarius deliciosus]